MNNAAQTHPERTFRVERLTIGVCPRLEAMRSLFRANHEWSFKAGRGAMIYHGDPVGMAITFVRVMRVRRVVKGRVGVAGSST